MKQILRKLRKQTQAVSPVIATLMLVLVTVGAAGAFYAWQTGWQQDNTEQMSDFDGKTNLVIGGSSTVLPFSVEAGPMFEKQFPYAKISYSAGGSGSGIIAVGEGVIELGATSRNLRSSDWAKYPDLIQHTVAYDALVMITPSGNPVAHLNHTEIRAIYYINSDPQPTTIPADVQSFMGNVTEADGNWIYNNSNVVCWGALAPVPIQNQRVITYERSDLAGTEPVFVYLLLKGGDEVQLSELGIVSDKSGYGNHGVLAALKDDPAAIGFSSFGQATGAGVHMIPINFTSWGQDDATAVTPSMSTISGDTYKAGRPIAYVTNGQPSGLVKQFLDFVRIPDHNKAICSAVDYVSLY